MFLPSHAVNAEICRSIMSGSPLLVEKTWLAVRLQLLFGWRRCLSHLGLSGCPELFCDDITHVLEIFQSLLKSIDSGGSLCQGVSARCASVEGTTNGDIP